MDTARLWALRSPIGLSVLTLVAGLGGFVVMVVQVTLTGVLSRLGEDRGVIVALNLTYVVAASVIGVAFGLGLRRRALQWFTDGREPTPDEARRSLRMPFDSGLLNLVLWTPGLALEIAVFVHFVDGRELFTAALLVVIGALSSSGFIYLLVDSVLQPAIPVITKSAAPASHPSTTARARLEVMWALSSGLPLATALLIVTDAHAPHHDRIRSVGFLAAGGLVAGLLATTLLSRALAEPLQRLQQAVQRIGGGDFDVQVPVSTSSEVGLLEVNVNEMAAGLRERARLRELFGRHVGADVVARALSRGMDLTGELREVTALFVDVVGSTELAHRIEPRLFVDKLNRLLAIVIDATEANGGLVNKFEGDAALCIFGAPIDLDDDATGALRAARRIRDRVLDAGELDIGIGVSRGVVFAGDVGAATRLEYTVIGDPVNEAARLTDVAKSIRQRILVSQAVIDAAGDDEREVWLRHGLLRLRGRDDDTKVWTDNTQRASAASSSGTSVTGRSQTNPRQTYAAAAPPTSGRPASSGAESGSPATTTDPPGAAERAAESS